MKEKLIIIGGGPAGLAAAIYAARAEIFPLVIAGAPEMCIRDRLRLVLFPFGNR